MAKYFVSEQISENISETPEGFLLCIGVPITRTGYLEYADGETPLESGEDGIVRILRKEEDVFHPATMASFEGKPVTITHPEDWVNPKNWKELTVGTTINVRRGSGKNANLLLADLLITDHDAILLVKKGLREVSCGYEAEFTQTGDGEGRQTNIVGNHVALVKEGRAGSNCAIKDNHKGAYIMSKLSKLKDSLVKKMTAVIDEEMKTQTKAITDEQAAKNKKTLDEAKAKKTKAKTEDADDAAACDNNAIMDAINKLNDKFEAFKKGGAAKDDDMVDDDENVDDEDEEKDPASDEDADVDDAEGDAEDLHTRIKALESELADLKKKVGGGDSVGDDQADEDEDEDEGDDDEEDEDNKDEFFDDGKGGKGKVVGDEKSVSRAEILAPGIDTKSKNLKVEALKTASKSKDGKRVIDSLTGGKAIDFKDAKTVDNIFIAASEILKAERKSKLASTKKTADAKDDKDNVVSLNGAKDVTPEMLNEIHAKHWAK